jgi:hypothetical protein
MRHFLWLGLVNCTPETPGSLVADAGKDRVIEVDEVMELDGSASTGATSWTWTFGDGQSELSTEATSPHAWEEPGHYTVYLQVSDETGRTETDSLKLTVHHPLLQTPPRASGTLVGDATGTRLYALLPDTDRVAVVDPQSAELLGHVETCAHPRSLTIREMELAIACPDVDQLWLYSLDGELPTPRLEVALDWGDRPFGVVFGGEHLFVTLQGPGELLALDSESGQEAWSIALGPDLRGLAWSDGILVASRHRSPDEGGQWWTIDEESGTSTEHLLAPDPGPDSDTNARGIPGYLQRIQIRPDGRTLVFPGLKSNTDRGTFLEGQESTPESTVRAILRHAVLNPDEGELGSATEEPLFDNRDFASAAAYTPVGDVVFVAQMGDRVIDALDAWSMQRVGGFQDLGHGLSGLWVSVDGKTLWALADFDRQIVALPIEDLSASPIETARIDLLGDLDEPLNEAVLEGKRIFYGAIDPRMSEDGYISCGSCHLDGEDDGRTWDFHQRGEGMRNTISLLGRAQEGHGPLHWSGNFDEIQDFENDIRGHMGGTGFLSEADWKESQETLGEAKAGRSEELDALAAFVASLDTLPRSPHREADGSLSEAALRGEHIFEDPEVGCTDCHTGSDYSDSAWVESGEPLLHDVGTWTEASGQRKGEALEGLDTPSLRGLHATGPYLHDGSAPDLEAVLIEGNINDMHGKTSLLSDEELADLVEFLSSLE